MAALERFAEMSDSSSTAGAVTGTFATCRHVRLWSLLGDSRRSRVSATKQLVVVSFPPKLHILRSLANMAH